MTKYNFESHNLPGFYIRHANFQGELSRKNGPMDDFAFTLVRRGAHAVAFRSANFPDRYLRHRDFRVYLQAPDGPNDILFQQDSTFTLVRPLEDDGQSEDAFSFRSANFPDRYLRHRDFHLWVEAPTSPDDRVFRSDATFHRRPAPVRID
jgi:hypothetical protein